MTLVLDYANFNNIKWLLFADGRYRQPCAVCGKVIPARKPRWSAGEETNPLTRATIVHEGCLNGRLKYNSWGRFITLKDRRTR